MRLPLTFSLVAAVAFTSLSTAQSAELTAAAVADPKGDGPDGQGNTADDTWQFWFQLIHAPQYQRLDLGTAAMTAEQRAAGLPGKVTGPIAAITPNAAETDGWIFHSDWDGRYEGIWGDKKANQVIAHPYNEKNSGGAVAVTYMVPADGKYAISGKVTDMQVAAAKHVMLTGVTYIVDIVEGGGASIPVAGKELKREKVGDSAGPESAEFKLEPVELKKGQLVRLAIDPNKWWGTDMTRIDSFTIEPVQE